MANASTLTREILLGFWKVHILHHAAADAIYGQWILEELRRHRYTISPGTVYPLLKRMERNGWLKCAHLRKRGLHSRREYRLTREGERILELLRIQVEELYHEVVEEPRKGRSRRRTGPRP